MECHSTLLWLGVASFVVGLGQTVGQSMWTKDALNPVLSGGGNGTWDNHVFMPSVLFNADSGRYEMWYGGSYGPGVSWRPYRIGFAWSSDGVNWTKYAGNPVLSPSQGTWDEGTVEGQTVIRENGQYKMWYTGASSGLSPAQIGYATSPDGIHWNKHAGNPVLRAGSADWEIGNIAYCQVESSFGTYTAWYSETDVSPQIWRIGRATSTDGINWQKDAFNNPVLNTGTSGQWDDLAVLMPHVLNVNNVHYMWYTGWRSGANPRSVGLATSTDGGITWTRYAGNPVLSPGSIGSWEANNVEGGTVMLRNGVLHIWYDGSTVPTASNLYRIGHATSIVNAVEGPNDEIPNGFVLQQNYPNPFNSSTTIRYTLPVRSPVTLTVFNTLGQIVRELVNGDIDVGHHEVQFDAGDLASGVYLCRMTAGAYTTTRKPVLVK
jgi:hypothetical protein